jgi:hypothetical protein
MFSYLLLENRCARSLLLTLTLVLPAFLSGCCTSTLLATSKKTTRDTFTPAVLYQGPNSAYDRQIPIHTRLAMGGTVNKAVPEGQGRWFHPSKHQIVPDQFFLMQTPYHWDMPAGDQKQQLQWFRSHDDALARAAQGGRVEGSLPPNYQRVADFPKLPFSSFVISGTEKKHTSAAVLAIPLTIAADVVTFPFQLIIGLMYRAGGNHC